METPRIKKGVSLASMFIMGVVGMVSFLAIFSFISFNASEASIQIEDRYNDSLASFQEYQSETDDVVNDIRDKFQGVVESESIVTSVFFGLQGMWAVFKAPLAYLSIATNAAGEYINLFDIVDVPAYMIAAIITGITIIVLLAIIAVATGRQTGGSV